MEKQQAWNRFNKWFNQYGHWIWNSREVAIKHWERYGIESLPRYPGAA